MELVDTHCHLDFNSFDNDREAVLSRAVASGVQRVVNPAVDLAGSREICHLAEQVEAVWAAVGVHPNDALSWEAGHLEALIALAERPKVVAIGEIGLDYCRDRAPGELQRRVFLQQLQIAELAALPIIVHNREATEDVLEILEGWQEHLKAKKSPLAERPGVLHSFSGGARAARRAIAANFYLGIAGPVTFRHADDLREVVSHTPLDRLLIETDAPFLTPHPYRGKRNEPAYVRYVAEKIAELHAMTVEEVAATTTRNAGELFQW